MDQPGRRRPRFFDGRLLSAEDLNSDQEYHRGMRHLQNRIQGWGIVEGLSLGVEGSDITVSPGIAIDRLGREIVLAEPVSLDSSTVLDRAGACASITATWDQVPDGVVPSLDPTAEPEFLFWLEQPRISVEVAAKVAAPTLVLGRVTRANRRGLTIDLTTRNGYRRRRYSRT